MRIATESCTMNHRARFYLLFFGGRLTHCLSSTKPKHLQPHRAGSSQLGFHAVSRLAQHGAVGRHRHAPDELRPVLLNYQNTKPLIPGQSMASNIKQLYKLQSDKFTHLFLSGKFFFCLSFTQKSLQMSFFEC